ncbi:MAG: PEP-CTERM sorting domain-containing protein [Gemmatimonadota bacterium]
MRVPRYALTFGTAAILAATPDTAAASPLCKPGLLSAYLSTSGVGCRIGAVRFTQFAQAGLAGFENLVKVTPWTVQGPPGFTWFGFSLRFDKGESVPGEPGISFSFLSSGSPLFGLFVRNDNQGPRATNITGKLTGDGGLISAQDRMKLVNWIWTNQKSGCQTGYACANGVSEWTSTTGLPDGDGVYSVFAGAKWASGEPPPLSIGILAPDAMATPEPATLTLIATGLAGLGANAARRRRRLRDK